VCVVHPRGKNGATQSGDGSGESEVMMGMDGWMDRLLITTVDALLNVKRIERML
jgi:hypothetical protein